MREIKYRAWDKNIKRMGFVFRIDYEVEPIRINEVFVNTLFYARHDLGEFVISDPKYIMQYTGLEDKAGKEICESDVIEVTSYPMKKFSQDRDLDNPYYTKYEVIYDAPKFMLGETYDFLFNGDKWEVIGNIYENPELLEK